MVRVVDRVGVTVRVRVGVRVSNVLGSGKVWGLGLELGLD